MNHKNSSIELETNLQKNGFVKGILVSLNNNLKAENLSMESSPLEQMTIINSVGGWTLREDGWWTNSEGHRCSFYGNDLDRCRYVVIVEWKTAKEVLFSVFEFWVEPTDDKAKLKHVDDYLKQIRDEQE